MNKIVGEAPDLDEALALLDEVLRAHHACGLKLEGKRQEHIEARVKAAGEPVEESHKSKGPRAADPADLAPPWSLTDVAGDLLAEPDLTRLPPRITTWLKTQCMTSLPTLTRHAGTTRGQARGNSREFRPTLPNVCEGCPTPELYELLMGLPSLYSDLNHDLVVSRRPTSGRALRVASICAGIGCSDYGVALAGLDRGVPLDFAVAVECDEFAAQVHSVRFPGTEILGNVRSPYVLRRLAEIAGPDGIDLAVLTLPCPPWSRARTALVGGGADHMQAMDPCDVIDALRPKVLLYENVEGILDGDAENLCPVLSDVEERGYRLLLRVVEAAEFGALHRRARVILIAVRNDVVPTTYDAPMGERPEECHRRFNRCPPWRSRRVPLLQRAKADCSRGCGRRTIEAATRRRVGVDRCDAG